jgi:hypothetical protein
MFPERDAKEKYWGDVIYEVYRRGGDVDQVSRDDTEDARQDGLEPDEAAARLRTKTMRGRDSDGRVRLP